MKNIRVMALLAAFAVPLTFAVARADAPAGHGAIANVKKPQVPNSHRQPRPPRPVAGPKPPQKKPPAK